MDTGSRDWSRPRRRGQRRQRGDGDTTSRLRRLTKSVAASRDSKESRAMVIRRRDRREGSALCIECTGPCADTGSSHPLLVSISQLKTEETVLVAEGDDKTVEAAL
ncbi:hypothetical protein NDU88_004535 [Pleurodeles waltl]|uniref:Uncharacterized protein n=1 Tax=Pleurodeles waltl TaxID=8319 RepID=A0AAV7TSP8_PLEWA|nr:hypothetical protein NDU88_004535 [Pleurodeles waltl]